MLKIESFKSQLRLKALNTIDLRLLVGLSMFSDKDGRINATLPKIKDLGYMTPKLVTTSLKRLLELGWIRKDGADYFTTYTTNTSANRKELYYINLFKFFQTETFKTMYKRDINFLFYILTSKLPGTFHSVEIERLYRNEINRKSKKGLLIDYFTNFEDLVSHLSSLIEKGVIEVKLGKESLLTETTSDIKEKFYSYCGKNSESRKKRIRNEFDHHVIHIRISKKVLKEKTTVFDEERLSTLQDLADIATKYQCSIDLYDIKELEPIHMFKNKLYETFGNVGIQVYRESVESFFKHQGHQFEKVMRSGADTFVKYLKHYYVMPSVITRLKGLFKELLNNTPGRSIFVDLSVEDMDKIVSLEQDFKTKSAPYVRYIKEEAYYDEIIKLNYFMVQSAAYNKLYRDFTHTNKDWMEFKQKVNVIFKSEEILGNTEKDVYRLALNNKLNYQERIDFQLNEKRDKERNERKKVEFYNWLEER